MARRGMRAEGLVARLVGCFSVGSDAWCVFWSVFGEVVQYEFIELVCG